MRSNADGVVKADIWYAVTPVKKRFARAAYGEIWGANISLKL